MLSMRSIIAVAYCRSVCFVSGSNLWAKNSRTTYWPAFLSNDTCSCEQ